jgi:alpha-glucosidase
MMNLQKLLGQMVLALALAMARPGAAPAAEQIKSPDGKVVVEFLLEGDGAPAYKIEFLGKPVVLESRLGFEPGLTNGFQMAKSSSDSHRGQWTNNFGERKIIPDNYGELNVDLKAKTGEQMRITFRAYNEGAAFRYSFPAQNAAREFDFTAERTEFRFAPDTMGYEEHGTEGEYARARVADIQPWCERPLTLELTNGLFASLAEADNENYPRMLLSGLPGAPGALVSALGGSSANNASSRPGRWPAHLAAGAATPWRTLILGEKPGELLERNYLILDLVPPAALPDLSWIQPGKVMRDTALTTANSKAIIDFAEKGGLQYVSLDTRWYGAENQTGDATTVRAPNLDLPEIIRYGSAKKVGVILYVDRQQIKKQRDILFPLYEKWGVKGVKIGFVDVGPQEETAWVTETVQKAAEHHLMLNIHDGYRSMGLSREYPNLLTVEGIRGNEHFPTPEHNCTVPFARYTAGPADYTVCYYDKRIKTTHAHQLAMAVVSFSPLQWIFWYDRPGMYQGEPEIGFFQKVPTVWDDTRVINGEIGKFATIARRSGDDWFIGTINNSEARELKVPLAFLDAGRTYLAHIYADDDTAATKTKVGLKMMVVNSETVLDAPLGAGGGQAVWIAAEQKPGR